VRRVLDLFSGIGGISLGLERTGGWETAAFCEIDPYCQAVLRERWPDVPLFTDVRSLSRESLDAAGVGRIDWIVGGFPCQPFSVAGKQKGTADERHLWPEYARLIRELRPVGVLAENVPGLRTIAADEVLSDLEAAGYAAGAFVVGADDVGAPHRRKRVWIVAHRNGGGRERVGVGGLREGLEEYRKAEERGDDADGCRGRAEGTGCVANARSEGLEGVWSRTGGAREAHAEPARCVPHRWPARPGQPQHEWEPSRLVYPEHDGRRADEQGRRPEGGAPPGGTGEGTPQPELGRDAHGLPSRLESRIRRERLKALGNSVVPQVVEVIGRAILLAEKEMM
jgi:DNA (cytosine-5)-methyltransferase 1